jgi:hypothetical protein
VVSRIPLKGTGLFTLEGGLNDRIQASVIFKILEMADFGGFIPIFLAG